MDDRKHFAALLWARRLGLIDKDQIVAAADQRIVELESLEPWLIDLSLNGDSTELEGVITSDDDEVFLDVLRRAYSKWNDGKISNKQLIEACRALWVKAGYQGVSGAEEFDQHVNDAIGRIIGETT
jgi:hypothetical protein